MSSVTDHLAAADAVAPPDGVWAPARRRLTTGLVLTITLVAFEALAIATVMPVVSDDLGGLGLYGWVFSGFFLGNLLGIVLAGEAADRRGTRARRSWRAWPCSQWGW
jgi:MFS family permease